MRKALGLLLVLLPVVAWPVAARTPGTKLVLRVDRARPARVLLVPGAGSASVKLGGVGVEKVTAVRLAAKRGKAMVAYPGGMARITGRGPGFVTIGVAAARGAVLGAAMLELQLAGVGGTVALPLSLVGVGIVPPGQTAFPGATGAAGLAGSGRLGATGAAGIAGSGRPGAGTSRPTAPSLSAQSGVRPGTTVPGVGLLGAAGQGAGGAGAGSAGAPSMPARTGGQPTSSQTNPSSMAQGTWAGTSSAVDRQSSGGSQSGTVVEYYSDERGTRTTVTTEYSGGSSVQSVRQETSDGKVTESQSVDGEEVAGTDDGGEDSGDAGASVSNVLEPTSSRRSVTRTMPATAPGKGNVDPAPDSGARSSGGVPAAVGPGGAMGSKGLGGDGREPAARPSFATPQKAVPATAPSKGNVDPVPEGGAPAAPPRTSTGRSPTSPTSPTSP